MLERIIVVVLFLPTVVFAVYSQYLVSGIEELVSNSDMQVPSSTALVFATYRSWLVLPVVAAIGSYFVLIRKSSLGWWGLFVAVAISLILLPVTVWTMYAAIGVTWEDAI
jgi:hypothetical protein